MVIILSLVGASAFASEANLFVQECLETNDVRVCESSQGSLWAMNEFESALLVANKICNHTPDRCFDMYFIAKDFKPEAVQSVIKNIEKRCEQNIAYCDNLARLYDEIGRKKDALKVAKKYFKQYGKGVYTSMAYEQGVDVKLAHAVALKSCREDKSNCTYTLRYMPDHPQRAEILANAEKDCLDHQNKSTGATSCTIAGTFQFKNKNYARAFELWSHDCQKNILACRLIFGAQVYSEERQLEAFRNFCKKPTPEFVPNRDDESLRVAHCWRQPASVNQVPQSLVLQSADMLQRFIDLQK